MKAAILVVLILLVLCYGFWAVLYWKRITSAVEESRVEDSPPLSRCSIVGKASMSYLRDANRRQPLPQDQKLKKERKKPIYLLPKEVRNTPGRSRRRSWT